jgi:hypothetical protein
VRRIPPPTLAPKAPFRLPCGNLPGAGGTWHAPGVYVPIKKNPGGVSRRSFSSFRVVTPKSLWTTRP